MAEPEEAKLPALLLCREVFSKVKKTLQECIKRRIVKNICSCSEITALQGILVRACERMNGYEYLKIKRRMIMSFEFVTKLPTPEEIRLQYPITEKIARVKAERDQEIKDIFTGKSDRFLVIIGPCSADNEDSVCDYVGRLAKVQDQVGDRLLLIPRIYTNKPRTTGEGYKGLLHQPDPEKKPDVLAGLVAIRKLHMRAIEETGLTAADEMLYPENWRSEPVLLKTSSIVW